MLTVQEPGGGGSASIMECPSGCLNGSLSGYNVTEPPYPLQQSVTLVVLAGALMFCTVFGNVLVVIAVFTSRALRAPQNLFLVSLAAADILVAALVIPFSLCNELLGYWAFGRVWCEVYLALDVLFCTSSIVHLCAISLDRYWSVTQAVRHNLRRSPRRVTAILITVWVISAVISFPPLLTMDKGGSGGPGESPARRPRCRINEERWYIISSSIGSFFAPCVIMVLVYVRIYQIAKRRSRRPPGAPHNGGDRPPAPATAKLNGEHEEEEGDLEDSSSSEHPEEPPRPAAGRQKPQDGKGSRGKTKLSQIKPGDPPPPPPPPAAPTAARGTGSAGSRNASKWRGRQNREKRFTFVLAVVIGVFVVCWFPFFFTYSLMAVCSRCPVPDTLFKFFFWFGYCNSCLNPVIYTIFNQDFRRAFKRILCRGDRRRVV